MKKDSLVRKPSGITSHQYLIGKEAEWEEYRAMVSGWEIDRYFMH